MKLAEARDGDRVFIDANIFIYHFVGRSVECKTFLDLCARRVLLGYTSTSVLGEVLHRGMIGEAVAKGIVTAKTAVRRLAANPNLVKELTQYQDDVDKIPKMQIDILNFTMGNVAASAEIRKTEGLLTNDSFIVAVMRNHGIMKLATANGDFDHVGGLEIYKPTDLE